MRATPTQSVGDSIEPSIDGMSISHASGLASGNRGRVSNEISVVKMGVYGWRQRVESVGAVPMLTERQLQQQQN